MNTIGNARALLVIGVIVGFFLRMHARSSFIFYPDGYQNLLVARNILDHRSVLGTLGTEGMPYPPFFMWTRPLYALLIALTQQATSVQQGALWVNVLVGTASILVAYALLRTLLSPRLAVLGALCIAVSFNHITWGGFILTETTSVFLLLVFLWSLFRGLSFPALLIRPGDLFTGIFFALALLTRYEYIVLIIPVSILVWIKSPTPVPKLTTIFTAAFVGASILSSLLFPLVTVISGLVDVMDLLLAGVVFTGMAGVAIGLYPRVKALIDTLILVGVAILGILLIIAFCSEIFFGRSVFPTLGILNFFINDPLLGLFFMLGSGMLVRTRYRWLILFSWSCAALLFLVYFHVNPQIQRYGNHLLPFLLLPAGLGISSIWERSWLVRRVVVVFVLLQAFTSYHGIRAWNGGIWYKESYEMQAAKRVSSVITEPRALILAALPEPYAFFTSQSIYSLSSSFPYIYIPTELHDRTIYVIDDMAMMQVFPQFHQFIQTNLAAYKVQEYWVGTQFRYTTGAFDESVPVKMYRLTVAELIQKIATTQPQ